MLNELSSSEAFRHLSVLFEALLTTFYNLVLILILMSKCVKNEQTLTFCTCCQLLAVSRILENWSDDIKGHFWVIATENTEHLQNYFFIHFNIII